MPHRDPEQRIYDLERAFARLDWRLERVEDRCGKLEPAVEKLSDAQMIADAVAKRMSETRTLQLTVMQKLLGGIVAVLAIADAIKTLVGG